MDPATPAMDMQVDLPASDPQAQPYQHEPLDYTKSSIRILNVLHDNFPDGMLRCTLSNATVNDVYRCLSYTWGPPSPTYQVEVDGRIMVVRKNLHDFLLEVRGTGRLMHRWWVDALCIDQNNPEERSHQVQHMGTIFSQAMQVVIWLGEAPGLGSILKLVEDRDQRWKLGGTMPRAAPDNPLIKHVYENPYWSRAWTTQEFGLAPSRSEMFFMCKGAIVSYLTLLHVMFDNDDPSSRLLQGYHGSSMDKFATQSRSFRGKRLMRLIEHFGSKECALPRDRIFSLLALCAASDRFRVDYSVPDLDVLYMVLDHCKDQICFCTIHLLARVLRLDETKRPSLYSRRHYPYIEVEAIVIHSAILSSECGNFRVHVNSGCHPRRKEWRLGINTDNDPYSPPRSYRPPTTRPHWDYQRSIDEVEAYIGPGIFAHGFELHRREVNFAQRSPRQYLALRIPLLTYVREHDNKMNGLCANVFRERPDDLSLFFSGLARIGYTTDTEPQVTQAAEE